MLWTDIGLQSTPFALAHQVVNHQVSASTKPEIQCWFDPRSRVSEKVAEYADSGIGPKSFDFFSPSQFSILLA